MSYDFMMFKVAGAVRSPDDIAEETTEIIDTGAEIQARLSRLYPEITWTRIYTSHRAGERGLIPEICRTLGLVAFDGQACEPIGL